MTRASSLLAAGLAALLCLVPGCGATALRDNARAALVTGTVLRTAGEQVDAARTARLDEVEAAVSQSPDRDLILAREMDRWEPVGAALDAARDALLSWVEALELARLADGDGFVWQHVIPLVLRLVLLYDDVARLASELGAEVPALPGVVRALATLPEGR